MGTTDQFKKTIKSFLTDKAQTDDLFTPKFENPAKNIDDCVTYILNTVQKSGINGFTDDEIFGMAIHYYDEESIEIGKPVNAKVVVNHRVEKTKKGDNEDNEDTDVEDEKPQAPKREVKKKKVVIKETPGVTKQSLFDDDDD